MLRRCREELLKLEFSAIDTMEHKYSKEVDRTPLKFSASLYSLTKEYGNSVLLDLTLMNKKPPFLSNDGAFGNTYRHQTSRRIQIVLHGRHGDKNTWLTEI